MSHRPAGSRRSWSTRSVRCRGARFAASAAATTATALLVTVALVGCGTGDDKSATTTTSPPVEIAEDAACTLVTKADAEAIFGTEAVPTAESQPDGVVSQCIYESAAPGEGQLLQFRIFEGTRQYAEAAADDGSPLEDLGDRAYLNAEGPSGIVDLQYTDDSHLYTFAYSNSSGDAAAKAPSVETFARSVHNQE